MSKITAIIVDDESRGRASLKKLCEKYCPDVKVCGLADSVAMAKKAIATHQPELVFLDIRMPLGDGFSLLESYDEVPFDVVFTTAYDQYALKAFRFSAIDYLLKPIGIKELKEAIEKIKKKRHNPTNVERVATLKENLRSKKFDKIALPTTEGFTFVKREEIMRCEASGNYTCFYLRTGGRILITKTLKYYDGMLSEYNFFRIHKSHLVNLSYIKKFIKGKQGYVQMIDGSQLEVSTRRREQLLRHLMTLS